MSKKKDSVLKINVQDVLMVKSNMVILSIIVGDKNKLSKDYVTAHNYGLKATENIIKMLEKLGCSTKHNKVILGQKYISTVRKEGDIVGYSFSQYITLRIAKDNDRIAEIYSSLLNNKDVSSINVNYTLKNTDKYKKKLMNKLIKKANKQADMIASTAGLKVIGIKKIEQSVVRGPLMEFCNSADTNENIEVDNTKVIKSMLDFKSKQKIEIRDSLDIVYNIKR